MRPRAARILFFAALMASAPLRHAWAQQSSPGTAWQEKPEWSNAEKMQAPERPFALSNCHTWLNQETKAILQVCSDRNWLAGKDQSDVEKLFLSFAHPAWGRTYLAENLMSFFFFFHGKGFDEKVAQVGVKLTSGKVKEVEEVLKRYLIANKSDNTQFALLVPVDTRDLRDLFGKLLMPGLLITYRLPASKEGPTNLNYDASFGRYRCAGLGALDSGGRKWLGFALIPEEQVDEKWVKEFGLPAKVTGRRVRFLWLIGGGTQQPIEGDHLTHVVLAELWDGSSRLANLAEAIRVVGFPPPAPLGHTIEPFSPMPRSWVVNDYSWKAKFGLATAEETSSDQVARDEMAALLESLPGKGEDSSAAEKALRALLETDPDSVEKRYALAWILNRLNRPDEALPEFEKVQQAEPSHPFVLFDIGFSYQLRGDAQKAEENYRAAIARNPGMPEPRANLCGLYSDTKQEETAAETCTEALQFNPDYPPLLNNLAWLLATSADPHVRSPVKALQYARKAAALTKEKNPNVLDKLAEAYFVNGQYDEAIGAETKALSLRPNDPGFTQNLERYRRAKQDAK